MTDTLAGRLREAALKYNDPQYFREDPIIFPKFFVEHGASLRDVEIAAVIAAHLAWGRRSMIVRDCGRALDEMGWKPWEYIQAGDYRDESASLHRTVRWSDFAAICRRLREFYRTNDSLEALSPMQMRTQIYGQGEDRSAACKKIHMLRRWMVRRDGIIDLGLWKTIDPASLTIPLDVHVHNSALSLGMTSRRSCDIRTASEITSELLKVFPNDPCLGDFALFGMGIGKSATCSSGRSSSQKDS
ncbi:MAG: DUF2400 domain-containing protein [Bacteroidales bacterium]|nr:DUF2400 domain-containing protein [Bacteroidales bacterium]